MSRAELILFRLNEDESSHLSLQKGSGGFQQLFAKGLAQFSEDSHEVRLNDEGLGMIVRHFSYGPGGFQADLKKVFRRSVEDLIRGHREK